MRLQKLQGLGVEEVAVECDCFCAFRFEFACCAVEGVSDDRVTDRREVDSDLVGASGVDADFEEREFSVSGVELFFDFVMGDGGAASSAAGGHAGASVFVAGDAGCDCSLRLFHPAVN